MMRDATILYRTDRRWSSLALLVVALFCGAGWYVLRREAPPQVPPGWQYVPLSLAALLTLGAVIDVGRTNALLVSSDRSALIHV
jgi:hypothetical protein